MRALAATQERVLGELRDEGLLSKRRLAVYESYRDLGALYARLGRSADAREAWAQGARWVTEAYRAREPAGSGTARTPRELIDALSIVIAFGTRDERVAMAELPRGSWYNPEKPYWDATALAAEALRQHVREPLTVDQTDAFVRELATLRGSDPTERRWARSMLYALQGVAKRNNDDLFSGFVGLLTWHSMRARREWDGMVMSLVAPWCFAVATLAAEAGLDVYAASPYFPEQALGLRIDLAWHGPWEDPAGAEQALDAVFSELGHSRTEPVETSVASHQVHLIGLGGGWWVESPLFIVARLMRLKPASMYSVRLTNHAGEDRCKGHVRELVQQGETLSVTRERAIDEAGLRRRDLPEAARAAWTAFASGDAPELRDGASWTYAMNPIHDDPELDRVHHASSEAKSWAVYTDGAPVQIRAQRFEGGDLAAIVDELEDWRKIEAKLGA